MAGHPHADDNQVDLGVLRYGVDVVERVHGVELCFEAWAVSSWAVQTACSV
jgi:hypothetical protein